MADEMARLGSSEEFEAWQAMHPGRWELYDGVPVPVASEGRAHDRAVDLARAALGAAISAASLSCRVAQEPTIIDLGLQQFVPDLVVAGDDVLNRAITAMDAPLVVVEIMSDATAAQDGVTKLEGYFSHPFVQHYLLVSPADRLVIHHRFAGTGEIWTRVHRSGVISLDPPGFTVAVEALHDNSVAEPGPA